MFYTKELDHLAVLHLNNQLYILKIFHYLEDIKLHLSSKELLQLSWAAKPEWNSFLLIIKTNWLDHLVEQGVGEKDYLVFAFLGIVKQSNWNFCTWPKFLIILQMSSVGIEPLPSESNLMKASFMSRVMSLFSFFSENAFKCYFVNVGS